MRTDHARSRALVVVLVASAASACFSERQQGITELPDECRALALEAGVPASHVLVGILDFAFVPADVAVPRGATVTWVNCEPQENLGHTATADPGGSEWGSPLLARGQRYSRTFTAAGEKSYHCEPHPFMLGKVVVQ